LDLLTYDGEPFDDTTEQVDCQLSPEDPACVKDNDIGMDDEYDDFDEDDEFDESNDPTDITDVAAADVVDPKDDIIKDLQERISKLEETVKATEPIVDTYNTDSVELMESVLRKVNAPSHIRQAYKRGMYEQCVKYLKEQHKILFDIYEGFTAKERSSLKKRLNELKAPLFVKRALENGQHSLVSAFFKSRGIKVRNGR